MSTRKTFRSVLAALALLFPLVLSQVATSMPASAAEIAVRTVYYDSSGAAEFKDAVDAGAAVWNNSVKNVRLVKGSPASLVIVADNGWPRAQTYSLGRGKIWFGRQAVNQGYNTTRIAAHEIGHIFGLPDRRTGLCQDLMSGSSAPVSCTNPNPNAKEKAEVEANFAGSRAASEFRGVYDETPVAAF